MTKNAEAKQKPIQRLFEYAGNFKYLTNFIYCFCCWQVSVMFNITITLNAHVNFFCKLFLCKMKLETYSPNAIRN